MSGGYEHLIGGIAGGLASTIVCHPLELLRIRYSVNEGNPTRPQYRGYWHATKCIVKAEGFRGLYQGLSPNILAAPLAWGLYFHLYHRIRPLVDPLPLSSLGNNFVVGCVSGGSVLAVTNPFWVVKTRLCLQYETMATRRYNGLVDCFRKTVRDEGFRGLYKGFIPGLFGTTHGAVQYAFYNYLKDYRCRKKQLPQDSKLDTMDYLVFSSASKMVATVTTYPYQVIRTRLQDHHAVYAGVWHCIKQTFVREGIYGLYKGMLAATFKQLPGSVITYMVYEYARYVV